MAQSLFRACKNVIRNGVGSKQNIGGYDVDIEYYTQEDIDENVRKIKFGEASACTFGDSDESKVVLVASPEITIPVGFTLTPVSPKKSLVIICNTFINEGTISMTAKAPNVLPHDWYIVGENDGYDEDVIIPAYANNAHESVYYSGANTNGTKGNNGIKRQCGSGGVGGSYSTSRRAGASGSGYAFGGGAGSGAVWDVSTNDVDTVYPMRGSNGGYSSYKDLIYDAFGGVGNPTGQGGNFNYNGKYGYQTSGCGGRIIIFCEEIINNGDIVSDGTASNAIRVYAGSSGAGAIDLFYTISEFNVAPSAIGNRSGGDGSVTFSDGDQAPLWVMPDCFKPRRKKFSKDNWTYLFSEYVDRLNQEV